MSARPWKLRAAACAMREGVRPRRAAHASFALTRTACRQCQMRSAGSTPPLWDRLSAGGAGRPACECAGLPREKSPQRPPAISLPSGDKRGRAPPSGTPPATTRCSADPTRALRDAARQGRAAACVRSPRGMRPPADRVERSFIASRSPSAPAPGQERDCPQRRGSGIRRIASTAAG